MPPTLFCVIIKYLILCDKASNTLKKDGRLPPGQVIIADNIDSEKQKCAHTLIHSHAHTHKHRGISVKKIPQNPSWKYCNGLGQSEAAFMFMLLL